MNFSLGHNRFPVPFIVHVHNKYRYGVNRIERDIPVILYPVSAIIVS